MKGKRIGYWKKYHRAKINNPLVVWKETRRVVSRTGPSWKKKKRGRPYKHGPRLQTSLILYESYFDLTLREAEGHAALLAKTAIDHSTIGRAYRRTAECYLLTLLRLLHAKLNSGDVVLMTDSTGISTDYKTGEERREPVKLSILAAYNRKHRRLTIANACVSKEGPDFQLLERLLVPGRGQVLLADRGYDSEANFKLAYRLGYVPLIKQRSISYHGHYRGKARRIFDEYAYRNRGIIEGAFARIEKLYSSRTRFILPHNRAVHLLCLCISHNIRTALLAQTQHTFFAFMVCATNPPTTRPRRMRNCYS